MDVVSRPSHSLHRKSAWLFLSVHSSARLVVWIYSGSTVLQTEYKAQLVGSMHACDLAAAGRRLGSQCRHFPIGSVGPKRFVASLELLCLSQDKKMLRLSPSIHRRVPLYKASGTRFLLAAREKVDRRNVVRFETPAVLEFEDGSRFHGVSFGAKKSMAGEVVFTTGMVGYPEALTDPSFKGQILNMTFPMIGNYGVPDTKVLDQLGLQQNIESDRIHAAGMIVQDYSSHYSHWNAVQSLSEWLETEGVPGIAGIDTRAITKKIRAHGAMAGRIIVDGSAPPELVDVNENNLAALVSTKEVVTYGKGNPIKILAVDCGIKYNIIRELVKRGAEVKRVPWNHDISSEIDWYDGLFISNGPGDPAIMKETTAQLRKALALQGDNVKPIFGICLGNQLLSLAAGAKTYKLPFGNRGQNQPVHNLKTGHSYITAQNHGYAVDVKTLPSEWEELFVNLNDGTNEGIIHKSRPYFTAQFHPEYAGGPTDTKFLFDTFLDAVRTKETGPIKSLVQRPNIERPKVKKVLVLGSGGLSIGQAGEFDYSGSQAIKALKEEDIETILINPNIASVQTNIDRSSEGQASSVYYLPVNPDFVEQVIKRERPDGILISMGGQTALNCGMELDKRGVFKKYGVQVLGTQIDVINYTEDRELFNDKLAEINESIAQSEAVESVDDAVKAAYNIGFPVMIRSAFALGGLGSGICEDEAHLRQMAQQAFSGSPQILVERSMKGWKEVEYEVVRDAANNCLTVCNMENFDPLGIHTGESIVIAPSQTLSDREYHMLRETALKVVRHLGIVGECNIQYALNPELEEYCIIEVNARLSRSSALASKATGYPLAFVAAKLALGINLPDLKNSVTKSTTACFEPSLDYCVAKMPRWDLAKFENVSTEIGSSMKSVGEVMSIARTFEEAIQKALRMVEPSNEGFEPRYDKLSHKDLVTALGKPTDRRIYQIAQALKTGQLSIEQVHEITKIDTWFLSRLQAICDCDVNLTGKKLNDVSTSEIVEAKKLGFSDRQLARMFSCTDDEVRAKRKELGIVPVVKQIDTLAAEYPAQTNYLYMTYNGTENDVPAQEPNNGVMVLGSGAYRIGSSVEFDWCAVSCIRTLRKLGHRAVMLNYNPETVSTDYDECDQLYFEELSKERVMDVNDRESVRGVVVSVGGQIPNNLALPLYKAGVKILGTHPTMIDSAEDRYKFSKLMDKAGVPQPAWKELTSHAEAREFAERVGYPVLVRPSYVLSGAAMNVAYNFNELDDVLNQAVAVSSDHPVVITKFVEGAKELELDAVAKDGKVIAAAISEHVENAGVHSGDATLVLPPVEASTFYINQIKRNAEKIAKVLNISGPFNAQFLAKGADVSVIECNLRASRSFPFVSKTTGADFINAATKVMVGESTENDNLPPLDGPKRPEGFVGIKSPMFSYTRLGGADPLLGVEMASTGEVACFGKNRYEAFLKALISSNFKLPEKNILLSMQDKFSEEFVHAAYQMHELGYNLFTTEKTHAYLKKYDIPSTKVDFPSEGDSEINALNLIKDGKIDLVVNLPNSESQQTENNYRIRRTAVDFSIPLLTNISLVQLFVEAMAVHKNQPLLGLEPDSLFDYYEREKEEDVWTDAREYH